MKQFTEQELIEFFRQKISSELGIALHEIDPEVEFINFGMDSVNAIFILQHLENFVGQELNPLLFWDYPTIARFSKHIMTLVKSSHS